MLLRVRTLRDWLFTVPTLLGIGIVLVIFEIVGRVCLLFGRRPFEWSMAALQRSLLGVFAIAGTRYVVEGAEALEPGKGYVLVSNHQSLLDIPIFGGLLTRNFPKYVAKRELGRWIPSVSLNLTRGGNAVIDRDDRDQAIEAITRLGSEAEERGVAVVMFPEGTRSRDGALGRFRRLGTQTLFDAAPNLPIIPTAIDGSWRVASKKLLPIPFGSVVRVRFGPFLDRGDATAGELLKECHEWIAGTLDEWREDAAVPQSA